MASMKKDRRHTGSKEKVEQLRRLGFTVRDIAKALDLSTQRIYQILDELKAKS